MKTKQGIILCLLTITLLSKVYSGEAWIDYNNLEKIELGESRKKVISTLGEPLLILASSEDDNTVYLFYNYHIKKYTNKNNQHLSM